METRNESIIAMAREVRDRLHKLANGGLDRAGHKATAGELKAEARAIREIAIELTEAIECGGEQQ